MSWLRIDDGFAEHAKVQAASERARWLHVVALCYCARNLTDGVLDSRAVKVVSAIVDKPCKAAVTELVKVGLWVELESGYQIKDYLDWNPDAATVKKLRKDRADAGRAGGIARREASATASAEANATALVRTPSPPIPSHESSTAHAGQIDLSDPEGLMKRLVLATGVRSKTDIDKITRTVLANKCSPGAMKLAITACTGPGVRDPLGVALSELKKRRAA